MKEQCSLNRPDGFAYPGQGNGFSISGYTVGLMIWLGAVAFALACYIVGPLFPVIEEIAYRIFHGPVFEAEVEW